MLLGMVKGHKFVFTLIIPKSAPEAVLDCNGYLESILHMNMLLVMQNEQDITSANVA